MLRSPAPAVSVLIPAHDVAGFLGDALDSLTAQTLPDWEAVVCAGIHMSDIPAFPYSLLWGERTVRSVANLTRADGDAFLAIAARVPIHTAVTTYSLEAANDALGELRAGGLTGAAVLEP